ncbi:hypothetical protein Q7P37_006482 [Cladosporium fusiforme]
MGSMDQKAWAEEKTNLGMLDTTVAGQSAVTTLKSLNGSHAKRKRSDDGKSLENIMRTGCIPCLIVGIPCNPKNLSCELATSTEWAANGESAGQHINGRQEGITSPESTSLSTIRLDTKWRRNWRERQSLNFFATFSAPQMAGFFEHGFWSRCIQYSYTEPVILHAVSAIGSLHESILQGAFLDERRKAQAVEFALTQCNRSIGYLTAPSQVQLAMTSSRKSGGLPVSKLALIACVLFTCFEALQGHSDSAIRHALQGKALMEAHYKESTPDGPKSKEEDIELIRTLVERLEVQATAVVGKDARPVTDETSSVPPLPKIDRIYNLEHAHSTLHAAMNSNMRYTQRVHPDAPADHHAITHAKKALRYGPWYAQWEEAFSVFLAQNQNTLTNIDRKRAMVLKANQIVGTMLATADQRAGATAYHCFEDEFRAIVSLSREVLADFSCPPLPTLTPGSAGSPYFSCSLWVTDPLWMAISRCRDPTIRQEAFALLRQNPRQEGIWHTGPRSPSPPTGNMEASSSNTSVQGSSTSPSNSASSGSSPGTSAEEVPLGDVPTAVSHAEEAGNMRARSEWLDQRANSQPQESTTSDPGD